MRRHPHFDLWFHDDEELGTLLGSAIKERITIHEWPLSCVQQVITEDRSKYIYKVQGPPTLEPDFYAKAESPLIVSTQSLPARDNTVAMVMEEVAGPRLIDVPPSEEEAPVLAEKLVSQIAKIEGDLPFFIDISSESRWIEYFHTVLDDIRACVADGGFSQVNLDLVNRLSQLSESPSVLTAIRDECGYVHSDLTAANVLVVQDGYRVLDWQRPIRGPLALDIATLLTSLGANPIPHVSVGILQLYHLLHIAWYAQCARYWLSDGKPYMERFILQIEQELEMTKKLG